MNKMDYLHCLEDVERNYGKGGKLIFCQEKECLFRKECPRARGGKKE